MIHKRLFLSCLFLLIIFNVYAQQDKGKLKGRVFSNQETLIGATITIFYESVPIQSTFSDENGVYELNSIEASKPLTLEVKYMGYEDVKLKGIILNPNETRTIDIPMNLSERILEEVVVTALGIKKSTRKLGYSLQEIKGNDTNKVRAVNPISSLTGKVSGLSIGASNEMLGRPEVVLRGSKDLLYVVDGVPINSDTWNISPDDIETYSVLKGPNAAALYGSRGINGAIIITTKRANILDGESNKDWTIDVNSSTLFEGSFLTLPESQHEYGRGNGYRYTYGDVLYDNSQRLPEWGPRFEGQLIKQYDSPWDPVTNTRTETPWKARGKDNFEKFIQTGLTSINNIAFAKGGEDFGFRFSYTHTYQRGTFPNTKLNGDNYNISGNYKLSDKLLVEGNLNLNLQYSPNIPDVNYGPNSYMYMFKIYGSSDYDIDDLKDIYKGPQGIKDLMQYSPEYGRLNSPWFIAKEWQRSHDKTDIYGYLRLKYDINDDFNISARSQITTWNQLRTEKVPASTNLNDYVPWYYFGWYGDYREDSRTLLENNSDINLVYNKDFDNWSFNALAGTSARLFKYHSTWGSTKGLVIPKLYSFSNSENPSLNYNYNSNMEVYSGYYSFDLDYNNYFNINNSGRVDKLSTLPKGNNVFFYPSISVSSILNSYLDLPSEIDLLKVRASYAVVKGGLTSSTIGSAFSSITGKSLRNGLLGYGTELTSSYDGPTYQNQDVYTLFSYYEGAPSVDFSSTISNPDLKPFSRKSFETGIDLRLFNNRIGIDFTYFRTINGPQIYNLDIAPSTSYKQKAINGVVTLNNGFEIGMNTSVIKNQDGFNWDISANWSTYKETLKEIYEDEKFITLNGHNYEIGDRLDAFYGRSLVRDGDGNIVHNGGLVYKAPSGNAQNSFLGNLNPDFAFGIINNFKYKNWNLSFQIDGRIGGKIYDFIYSQSFNGGTGIETATGDFGEARYKEWVSFRDNGTITPSYIGKGVKIVSGNPEFENGQITNLDELTFETNDVPVTVQSYITGSNGLYGNTEYFMIDRSFVKLRELSLSYTLPKKIIGRALTNATISFIGRNLLYFAARKDMDLDSYPSGFNSSDRSVTGGDLQSASIRYYGMNLNLSF